MGGGATQGLCSGLTHQIRLLNRSFQTLLAVIFKRSGQRPDRFTQTGEMPFQHGSQTADLSSPGAPDPSARLPSLTLKPSLINQTSSGRARHSIGSIPIKSPGSGLPAFLGSQKRPAPVQKLSLRLPDTAINVICGRRWGNTSAAFCSESSLRSRRCC